MRVLRADRRRPALVDLRTMRKLPPGYDYGPRSALAAGTNGLDFARKILHEAKEDLNPMDGSCVKTAARGAPWGASIRGCRSCGRRRAIRRVRRPPPPRML